MREANQEELRKLTEKICILTMSKEVKVLKDGEVVSPEDGNNAFINAQIRGLRAKALRLRGASHELQMESFRAFEGREED